MPKTENQKDKETSAMEDLKELAQFREKKKIQNEALKKIVEKLSTKETNNQTSK